MKKIIFVGQNVSHFSYYKSSLIKLIKLGYFIEIRLDEKFSKSKLSKLVLEFLNTHKKNTSFNWSKRGSFYYSNFLFLIRELISYSWYLRRKDNQSEYYTRRWADFFPNKISRILHLKFIKSILKNFFIYNSLILINKILPPPFSVILDVYRTKPDLIYASPANMKTSIEVNYLKAGNLLKLKTIIYILSWDNLTTKGVFHAKPDYFLVWNNIHKNELVKIHKQKSKIEICGPQLFDKWLYHPNTNSTNIGYKNYVLYLGSSINIIKDEKEILENLCRVAANYNYKVLFKSHPFQTLNYTDMSIPNLINISDKIKLIETDNEINFIKNLFIESKAVIGVNTSGMIDALACGASVYSIIQENSNQTQLDSSHFKILIKYNSIKFIKNFDDIFDSDYSVDSTKFIKDFMAKESSSAGVRAAKFINSIISS